MTVKEYTKYTHYKGGVYRFLTIALPIESMPELRPWFGKGTALHTELEEDIKVFNVGSIFFTEKSEFLVIYKLEDDPVQLYARPVDMFFGKTDANIKRFVEAVEDGQE